MEVGIRLDANEEIRHMKFFSEIGALLLCIATTIALPAQKVTTLHSFDSRDGQLPGQ